MKTFLLFAVAFTIIDGMSLAQEKGGRCVVGYWMGDSAGISEYSLRTLTHLQFSFIHVNGDTIDWGGVHGAAAIRHLVALKRRYPALKIMLSLGGWGGCPECSETFSRAESRTKFVASARRVMAQFNADGLDFDWEYPSIEGYPGHRYAASDQRDFTLLLKELRAAFGSKYEISFAAGGFQEYLEKSVEWRPVMDLVDRVNIMSYDLVNGYSTRTGHQTSLYASPDQRESADNAVRYLDSLGINPKKIVIGSAFYARVWENVDSAGHGLFRDGKFKTYVPYNRFAEFFGGSGWTPTLWDSTSCASYRYNTQTKLFATFDDPRSVEAKVGYVKKKGLGGIMFWELHNDLPRGGLLDVIAKSLER